MKLKVGLLLAWVIPLIFLFFVDVALLLFITSYESELKSINRAGYFLGMWILLTGVWIFGLIRIIQWLSDGKFDREGQSEKSTDN